MTMISIYIIALILLIFIVALLVLSFIVFAIIVMLIVSTTINDTISHYHFHYYYSCSYVLYTIYCKVPFGPTLTMDAPMSEPRLVC